MTVAPEAPRPPLTPGRKLGPSARVIEGWDANDPASWDPKIAWRTLNITTYNLTLAFVTWYLVSAFAVRLPGVGFDLSTSQLFWLTAMPGLAAGILRMIWTFLPPVVGTRRLVTFSTLLLLVPLLGWGFAVQDPSTPFGVLLLLAFLAGIGGGNFSGFMPSTSYFFPKGKQGTVLGIQAGIGNFGVSLVQFLAPWLIGFAMLGGLLGSSQRFEANGLPADDLWLQNAAFFWVPFVLVGAGLAWFFLRSVPVQANFKQQRDIFREKHTWVMTALYLMTFGAFSGLAATFAILIRDVYGDFADRPDPLAWAFLGPLVGSAVRVVWGPLTDRFGGAFWTTVSGIGIGISAVFTSFFLTPDERGDFTWFVVGMLGVFFFAGIGNASTFKQMPMIFQPRQAGGVIGFTAAVAALGPFLASILLAWVISWQGDGRPFFHGLAIYCGLCVGLNWWYYQRKGAEKPC
jgi:NNP family nitrate/nitrite transporter-like MFS transporter